LKNIDPGGHPWPKVADQPHQSYRKRLRAERPNQVWALDFQRDQSADGRVIRVLNVVDELAARR
jgi:hypothetical protein